MKKIRIAILISGRGSNMEALIDACNNKNFPAKIGLVISNRERAQGLKTAQIHNIKTVFIDHRQFSSRKNFDEALHKEITKARCQFVCLAGFMRLLSGWFTGKWAGRALNIHPSLLPAFKGANAIGDALQNFKNNNGLPYSGCTVHYLSEEMDSGKIIRNAVVPIKKDDTEEILAARILQQEHIIYPQALKQALSSLT